jgi:hypothetical protein
MGSDDNLNALYSQAWELGGPTNAQAVMSRQIARALRELVALERYIYLPETENTAISRVDRLSGVVERLTSDYSQVDYSSENFDPTYYWKPLPMTDSPTPKEDR